MESASNPGKYTIHDTCDFMKFLMAECNSRDYVEKVIWKDNANNDPDNIGDLFDSKGNLTKAGETWASL
jgi:hypothetical protein